MKALSFLFLAFPLYSNTFELPSTSSRFLLEITPGQFFYKSETMIQKIKLESCSQTLAKELNDELLSTVASPDSDIDIFVDGKKYRGPASPYTVMDLKVLSFLVRLKELCP